MNTTANPAFIAFNGDHRIAAGDLREVARAAKQMLDRQRDISVLIFDGLTSQAIDLDFRGSVDDVHKLLSLDRIDTPASLTVLRRERKLRFDVTPVELRD